MIISASRRTDICAFHTEWFMNRLDAGYVMVRNPIHRSSVLRVPLNPDVVDHIVFMTKDPSPMIGYLPGLSKDYSVSFQVTITPYGKDIEPNVPDVGSVMDSFVQVSDIVGPKRTIWRFDPVLFDDTRYTQRELMHMFEYMCQRLKGHTERCIMSFLKYYRRLENTVCSTPEAMCQDRSDFLSDMVRVAKRNDMVVTTCCEAEDIRSMVDGRSCIDPAYMREWGVPYTMPSSPIRKGCGCVKVVDIGEYDTCLHDCVYCYANTSSPVDRRKRAFDPRSEFLCGHSEPDDIIRSPTGISQSRLF